MTKKSLFFLLFVIGALVLIQGSLWAEESRPSGDSFPTPSPYGPESRHVGAGIVLGEPVGLTVKGYLSSSLALNGIASWSFTNKAFTLIGDFTYDFFDIKAHSTVVSLPFYAGAGGKVAINAEREGKSKSTTGGVRIPVGVACQWRHHPVETFLEIAPGMQVAPDTEFDLTGGIGVRYYF